MRRCRGHFRRVKLVCWRPVPQGRTLARPGVSIRKLFASDRGLFANESDGDKTTSAPSAFRSFCGRSAWIGARADFRAKVHLHHAFFEHAATPGAERLIVFPPKQRLSQARRRRIVKANDFQCRNHYRIGIIVLLHRHQEGSADIRPGHHRQGNCFWE